MKNRIKRLLMAAAALGMTLISVGCTVPRLAVPDNGFSEKGASGRLVGVYITKEPLSSTDLVEYLKEQLGMDPSETDLTETVGNVCYATLTETVFEANGETYTSPQYVFEGLEAEGMLLGAFFTDLEGEPYTFFQSDEGFSDLRTALHTGDDGESTVQSAVIYQESVSIIWYFNPVYQTEDGTVYLTAGEGIHVSGGQGVTTTQTLKDSVTVTADGVAETVSSEITVSVIYAKAADRVVVLQMDAEHRELAREEYTPDTVPKTIPLSPDCAYVLVESHTDGAITRALWQEGDDAPYVFRSIGNGICIKETLHFEH